MKPKGACAADEQIAHLLQAETLPALQPVYKELRTMYAQLDSLKTGVHSKPTMALATLAPTDAAALFAS